EAPLLLVRPSGAAEEKGPQEARDDAAFTEVAFRTAADMRFHGPLVLLKDPPRAGSGVPDAERVQREVEAGFTGVSLAAADTQEHVRDAALAASAVCQMELGLEIVPLGGARAAAELARQLRARGAPPSAVRISGLEDQSEELSAELGDTALSTAIEAAALESRKGLRQLVASGPFLRALRCARTAHGRPGGARSLRGHRRARSRGDLAGRSARHPRRERRARLRRHFPQRRVAPVRRTLPPPSRGAAGGAAAAARRAIRSG